MLLFLVILFTRDNIVYVRLIEREYHYLFLLDIYFMNLTFISYDYIMNYLKKNLDKS